MKTRAVSNRPRQRCLGLEQLESRVVLDGNVGAFVSGGNLHILGDSADNQIMISQSSLRSFTVSSRDGTTTINGQTGDRTFTGVRNGLNVNLGDGNNLVEIAGASGNAVTVSRRLNINAGSGDDQVLLTNVRASGLH